MGDGGKVAFTLGLETGGFLSALGPVGASVKGFIASFAGMGAIAEGVFGQIERGTALEHLSKRTGETVQSLYQLQKGFKAAGVDASAVAPVLFQMQRAIGGFNELGEPTRDIFAGLGLSVKALKSIDAPAQLEAIGKAIAGLNREEAASAASKIFGRAGAGDALQIARSWDLYSEAVTRAASTGRLFGEHAETFRRIEASLDASRNKAAQLFLGLAAGAAPAIRDVVDSLNKIDLSGIGQYMGKAISLFAKAFKDGNLSKLVGLGLQVGFDVALEHLKAGLIAIASAAPSLFKSLFKIGQASGEGWDAEGKYALAETFEQQANQMGPGDPRYKGLRERAEKLMDSAGENEAEQKKLLAEAEANFKESYRKARDNFKTGKPASQQELDELIRKTQLGEPGEPSARPGENRLSDAGASHHHRLHDIDALTRIGGFSTSGSIVGDHARVTATNTTQIVLELRKLNERLHLDEGTSTKNR